MAKKTTGAKTSKGMPFSFYSNAADRKRLDFYDNMTEEQQKDFRSKHYLLARIMSSGQGSAQSARVYYANEVVNKNAPNVKDHPELAWKLLTVLGTGSADNHPFLKVPKGKRKKDRVREFLSTVFPHFKDDELDLFLQLNDRSTIEDLAQQHGYTQAEIRDLFK